MNIWRWIVRFILAAIAPSILPLLAIAQPAAPPNPEMAQACPGPVARDRAPVIPLTWRGAPNIGGLNSGAFNLAALNSDHVRLTFLGHATSLIESPQLVRIAYRLQRLRQITAGAGHRHHEPCARHALHRPSRSGDQIRAARLGRDPRSAGQLGPEIS